MDESKIELSVDPYFILRMQLSPQISLFIAKTVMRRRVPLEPTGYRNQVPRYYLMGLVMKSVITMGRRFRYI